MSNSIYWFNIQGCLEQYGDIVSSRAWLVRARRELNGEQFSEVVNSINAWLLERTADHELVATIFDLLSEFHPGGDKTRREQYREVIRQLAAANRATEERERVDAWRRDGERRNREEQERLSALRLQEKEQERIRLEKIRNLKEAERNELLVKLRGTFRSNFLDADSYFEESCATIITREEFEVEKFRFVKNWLAAVALYKNGATQLPDDEQVAAISAVRGHVQVIARAGSGKTTTLVNRAFFLLKHCRVAPTEILILTFNRKAASEVRRKLLTVTTHGADSAIRAEVDRRIGDAGKNKLIDSEEIEASAVSTVAARLDIKLPYVMTFHALAYAIVHPEEGLLYNGEGDESQVLSRVVQQLIDDHLQKPSSRGSIRELMLAHFREDWDRIVEGRHDQSKEEFMQFRRSLPRQSLGGDDVKSRGEKIIADFLFEHDIAYKYERSFWMGRVRYHPDFTIFITPKSGLIIEYFGLKGDPGYDEMSKTKRNYWKDRTEWTLLEFSPEDIARNGVASFLDLLKISLVSQGVACTRLSEDEIWNRICDRAIDKFTKATEGFIGRCRKQSLSHRDLQDRIKSYSPVSQVEAMFLDVAQRLYGAYLDRLASTGEQDFNGLMQRAAETVASGVTNFQRKSGGGDLAALRHICIDEFQDFSDLFYRLLVAIRKANPSVELFCVGDDWQAINGFAGSDLRFFNRFEDYIGKSRQLYISTNYRSPNSIVSVGNALMSGLGKPASGSKKTAGKVVVSDLNKFEPSLIEKERHSGDTITPAVCRLASNALAAGMDVVMLCRRNHLPWFVNHQDRASGNERGLARYLDLVRSFFPNGLKERISISTAHKYKGLEKPMVIVLDALANSYPLIHPDWIFSRILGDSLEKIAEEERRLLYVALTRAADTLVIVTDGKNKSPFLMELERQMPLAAIDWAEYPPTKGTTTRLVVKIGNQEKLGGTPTIAIKDLLRASRYQYQSSGWRGWVKTFPAEGFRLGALRSELWSASANGVDLRVFDDAEKLLARYLIDEGRWVCHVDNLQSICTPINDSAPNAAELGSV